MNELVQLLPLATALAIGLLVGLERNWRDRGTEDGGQVAGIRTFGLVGLLGGVAGLLAVEAGPFVVPTGLIAIALVDASGQARFGRPSGVGITSVVAAMVTFLLGVWATMGHPQMAATVGVVVAVLLNLKPRLHQFIARLSEVEIGALLRFLVISLVVLPVLPDRGFGPYEALNPYAIWWMVVLIAGLSFAGYVAVRVVGPGKGHAVTGLLGGLVSSTAVTTTLARIGRERPGEAGSLVAGILLASTMMALRIVVIAAVIAPVLAWRLGPALVATAIAGGLAAWFAWRTRDSETQSQPDANEQISNPLDLPIALRFGAILSVILIAARFVEMRMGDWGLLALGAISGIADVDAITLSMSGRANEGAAVAPLALAILIAAASNTLVKAGLAISIGGGALARRAGYGFALMLGAGVLGYFAPGLLGLGT